MCYGRGDKEVRDIRIIEEEEEKEKKEKMLPMRFVNSRVTKTSTRTQYPLFDSFFFIYPFLFFYPFFIFQKNTR